MLLYLAAAYGEDSPAQWVVLDSEQQADAWQAAHPTGVTWRVEVEVCGDAS